MPMDANALRKRPTAEWIESIRSRYPVERTIDQTLTSKLKRRIDGLGHKSDVGDVYQRLHSFLGRHLEGPFQIRDLAALTGGASKEQFAFELDWVCRGERRVGEKMVLRREPPESVVETSRVREFQIIAALEGIVPVPKAYWLDGTGEFLGAPSLVYSFVNGVQKPSKGVSQVTGVGIQFSAGQRAALAPQFIEYLAKIHNFTPGKADLSAFDLPRIGTTDDVDGQINWWRRVWDEDRFEQVPLISLGEQWLRANRVPLDHCSLVHSDYRTGNYLFDEDSLRITAVLDWELCYFGDRHMDLAWVLMQTFEVPAEDGSPLSSSLLPKEQLIAAYEKASGLTVDRRRLHYYTVLSFWRGAIMTLGSALRCADGAKTHQDIVLTWFGALGYSLLESLRRALLEAGV